MKRIGGRRWCIVMVLTFLLTGVFGFAQEDSNWFVDKPLADFEFTGLITVSVDELRPLLEQYVEKRFTWDLFWEIQEKLYALEYFDSIEVNAEPGGTEVGTEKDSVVLEFIVRERPSVSDVEVVGNRRIGRSEIVERILLKRGDMVSQSKLGLDEDAVRQLYLENGFDKAQVDSRLEIDEQSNRAKLVFEIVEGKQTTIKEIKFSGNSYASESTLRRIMKTKAQSLFNSGVYQESQIAEDKELIREYYGEHGYPDARVAKVDIAIQTSEDESRNFLMVTAIIEEGEQFTYGGLEFSGNRVFSTAKLEALVRQTPGKTLNTKRLKADYQRIVELYTESGYIFNQIDLKENRDVEKLVITYTVQVIERDRAHIENIIFRGNEKTQDFVLMRQLPFDVGDIFNRTKILQGWQNLSNLQYFSTIVPEFPPGSTLGLMDVVFNVEETNTADIRFGVSFGGSEFPVSGLVNWSEKNFLGRGQSIGVNVEASPLKQTIALNFLEPWMFSVPWSGGISFSFDHSLTRNILQDILPPVFYDDSTGVPDPFDGHYVFGRDTVYPAGGASYSAGEPFPSVPSSADIQEYDLLTDYGYSVKQGEATRRQYTMQYDSYDLALSLTTGYRYQNFLGWFGVYSGISSRFRYLTYDQSIYRPFELSVRENQGRWSIINKLDVSAYWDKRDNFLNPQSGFYLGQSVALTGGILGGDKHFIRTESKAEGFLTLFSTPVFENWDFKLVAAAHSALLMVLPQFGAGQVVADSSDLLFIDGLSMARGWNPLSYGKALWDNRFELRVPVAEQILWGLIYFDAAALWGEVAGMQTIAVDDFFFSVGAGLRFTIPQFPIRLYLSQGFQFKGGRFVLKEGDLPLGGLSLDFVISLGGDTF